MSTASIIKDIADTLEQRKGSNPDDSYTASLFAKGIDSILLKVAEESAETLLASKDGNEKEIIHETADLWFHTMVMLTHHGIRPERVLEELQRRFGVSGHTEKAARPVTKD